MKIYFIFFLLLILSCQKEKKEVPVYPKDTTGIRMEPYRELDKPFYLDSIFVNDTTETQANVFRGYFPQSRNKKHAGLNRLARTYVENLFTISIDVSIGS